MSLRNKLILSSVIVLVSLVLVLTAATLLLDHRAKEAHSPNPVGAPATERAGSPSPSPGESGEVDRDLSLMAAMPSVRAHSSKPYPLIPTQVASQPDLFARAFTEELFTQNYASNRADLISWVQAEAATSTEPLVVGLVPPSLRSRLAVYSVSESSDGTAVPIPSAADWAVLRARHASSSVRIQKVIEPLPWSDALEAGELSDPAITERQVDAEVTTEWRQGSRLVSSTSSIALTMNLEGPPARACYGFVTSPLYSEVSS